MNRTGGSSHARVALVRRASQPTASATTRHLRGVMAMTQVEVRNADETLLHRVSVRHAVRMIWRGVATPVEVHATERIGPYRVPVVVRLVRYVEQKWLYS